MKQDKKSVRLINQGSLKENHNWRKASSLKEYFCPRRFYGLDYQDRDLLGERTRALLQESALQHAFLAAPKKIGQHLLCVSVREIELLNYCLNLSFVWLRKILLLKSV